jgi:hypothetical protein
LMGIVGVKIAKDEAPLAIWVLLVFFK